MLGKGCQTLVLPGPRDNHVHVLAQHATKILNTFSFPKTDIIAQKEAAPTELQNRRFKTYPCPQRRLFEKHRQHTTRQDRLTEPRLVFGF